tara:strand:- start:27 stop:506 length:480 start_codon:yes stop_codon:yes gene_type:complete
MVSFRGKLLFAVLATSAVLALGFYFIKASSDPYATIGLMPNDEKIVTLGQKIYFENCASCHGVKLEGQPNWRKRDAGGYLPAPPHDETGHTWHHSDGYLFMITKFGLEKILDAPYPNNMPVYASLLSDEEIIAVLSYIKSQWPKTIQRQHDAINTKANM